VKRRPRKPARSTTRAPSQDSAIKEREELRRRQAELDQGALPEAPDGLVISPRGPAQPDADWNE
jgi:hypothetical protein